MDAKSLDMLEYPRILQILADYTSFSLSRSLALNLKPSSDYELVKIWLQQSKEARQLLAIRPNFSIGSIFDVRELAILASKGKVLETLELNQIKDTLASGRNVKNNIKKLAIEIPLLTEISTRIVELVNVEKEIEKSVTEGGEISDSASVKLADLRGKIKDTRSKLLNKLDSLLKSKNRQKFIQEPYITERDGRYVIPVKAEFKKDLRGIVHDVSNTGATIFVEPWETVEIGNELRQLLIEEDREIQRILVLISNLIGLHVSDICQNVEILAEIDLILAKAKYAETLRAVEPIIIDIDDYSNPNQKRRILKLIKARHPLLRGKVVPLDVEMNGDHSILVITGPNAGGKTVALKTIGLLVLMTQTGIPIPADENSIIPIFDGIYADIGDQQSIEQTFSTFSWHITNINNIIKRATDKSMVLLDELGVSTDPDEGAALAKAILLYFLEKCSFVVATTHYSDLKVFAHITKGIQNASLDFDPVTMMPTYKLTIGIPGRSNALAVAASLGLYDDIVKRARELMDKRSEKIEDMLTDLMSEKKKYEALKSVLEEKDIEINKIKRQLEEEGKKLKDRERKLVTEISDSLLSEAADLRKTIREVENELRKKRKREVIEKAKKLTEEVIQRVNENIIQTEVKLDKTELGLASISNIEDIIPGDIVRIRGENITGIVLSVDGKDEKVEIRVGNTNISIRVDSIEKVERQGRELPIEFPVFRKRRRTITLSKIASELDLRGKRASEIENILDKFLNDAFLANLRDVRIIHGYGTGTVRNIVREILASHSLVRSFEPGGKNEGGDGVTLVHL